MQRRDLLLHRLDDIGRSLAQHDAALALIALGSVGRELDRLDDYSDLDFFVVVENGYQDRFRDELSWLDDAYHVTFHFRNTDAGCKFLFADGIYGEMAVFGPEELSAAAYSPGRMVWRREGVPERWAGPLDWPPRRAQPETEWLLGEALTNLYVGLSRYRRGEKLSAFRFIQHYAVDRVVDLANLLVDGTESEEDLFDRPRRFEQRCPSLVAELPALMQGYERGPESAAAILALLDRHFSIEPAMIKAISALLSTGGDEAGSYFT